MDAVKHRVVMQVTQGDAITQLTVVGQVKNILRALPETQLEVVCHGGGLDMLVSSVSKVAVHVSAMAKENVVFVACENTMKRNKVSKHQLLPEATVMESALVELILKQEAGWVYVKGGHWVGNFAYHMAPFLAAIRQEKIANL